MNKKNVLITGASRGIGAASAKLFAQQGYNVCVNYKNRRDKAESVCEEIRQLGAEALPFQADLSREEDISKMFDFFDKNFGYLDALVNNAGILMTQTKVENLEADRINKIFAVNVVGAFLCCREAVKRMSTKSGGSGGTIVNLSSVASRTGSPFEYVDYAASKAALDALTKGLALEVAEEGIRVNSVRPGFIYTDMHSDGGEPGRVDRLKTLVPLKRGGTADEVAQAVFWLASAQSSYTTGFFLEVSGGR